MTESTYPGNQVIESLPVGSRMVAKAPWGTYPSYQASYQEYEIREQRGTQTAVTVVGNKWRWVVYPHREWLVQSVTLPDDFDRGGDYLARHIAAWRERDGGQGRPDLTLMQYDLVRHGGTPARAAAWWLRVWSARELHEKLLNVGVPLPTEVEPLEEWERGLLEGSKPPFAYDEERHGDLMRAAAEVAEQNGYCSQYDAVATAIGAPTRDELRKMDGGRFDVTVVVTTYYDLAIDADDTADATRRAMDMPIADIRQAGTFRNNTRAITYAEAGYAVR